MGAQWHGKNEQTREEERAIWSLLCLACAVLFFVTGLGAGARWFGDSQSPSLPDCQEDEVLYPVNKAGQLAYTGSTQIEDLGCVHIDTLLDTQH